MARMRTSKRMKGIHDSDARGRFKQTRRRSAVNQLGHEISRTHSALERTREKLDAIEIDQGRRDATLFVDFAPAKAPRLSVVQAAEIRAGDRVVLETDRPRVRTRLAHLAARRERVRKDDPAARAGPAARVPRERLLVLPQELGADRGARVCSTRRARSARTRAAG